MSGWVLAFVLTVAVEVAVAVPLLAWLGSPASTARRTVVVILASALTHPFLWLAVRWVGDEQPWWTVAVLVGEGVVMAVEAVVLAVALPGDRPDRSQRIYVSILMNGVSAAVGLTIVALR